MIVIRMDLFSRGVRFPVVGATLSAKKDSSEIVVDAKARARSGALPHDALNY